LVGERQWGKNYSSRQTYGCVKTRKLRPNNQKKKSGLPLGGDGKEPAPVGLKTNVLKTQKKGVKREKKDSTPVLQRQKEKRRTCVKVEKVNERGEQSKPGSAKRVPNIFRGKVRENKKKQHKETSKNNRKKTRKRLSRKTKGLNRPLETEECGVSRDAEPRQTDADQKTKTAEFPFGAKQSWATLDRTKNRAQTQPSWWGNKGRGFSESN